MRTGLCSLQVLVYALRTPYLHFNLARLSTKLPALFQPPFRNPAVHSPLFLNLHDCLYGVSEHHSVASKFKAATEKLSIDLFSTPPNPVLWMGESRMRKSQYQTI